MSVRKMMLAAALLLVGLVAMPAEAQTLDPVASLPIAEQALIGSNLKLPCLKVMSLAGVSGPVQPLFCRDGSLMGDVTVLGVRDGTSYVLELVDGSTISMPISEIPTDPCFQTAFRIHQFDKQIDQLQASGVKKSYGQLLDQIYSQATDDDFKVAWSCVNKGAKAETKLGGMKDVLDNFGMAEELEADHISTVHLIIPKANRDISDLVHSLDNQTTGYFFINTVEAAWYGDLTDHYGTLRGQYNTLVVKYNKLLSSVQTDFANLKTTSPQKSSAWSEVLSGALSGLATWKPQPQITCTSHGHVDMWDTSSGTVDTTTTCQ
jgi:hypothetical protein